MPRARPTLGAIHDDRARLMRIVAGAAKGRRLVVPAHGTRPTSERAREALFNSLTALLDVDGARVLDLFAGSGAVGLEALSRGAAAAWLVESDRAACDAIGRNIDAIALEGAVLRRAAVETFLAGPAEQAFDLAFFDPPYEYPDDALAEVLAALADWLAPDAVVVVERPARGGEPSWPGQVTPLQHKRYGDGTLWYGRAK